MMKDKRRFWKISENVFKRTGITKESFKNAKNNFEETKLDKRNLDEKEFEKCQFEQKKKILEVRRKRTTKKVLEMQKIILEE